MSNKHLKRKQRNKAIATHRINTLMHLAEHQAHQNQPTYANRYTHLARKLSMRYLVPIPPKHKRRICTHCYHYLLPGKTSRTRIHRGRIITYCTHCHHHTRIPLHHKTK